MQKHKEEIATKIGQRDNPSGTILKEEKQMATLLCRNPGCKASREITLYQRHHAPDYIKGVLICGLCKEQNPFEHQSDAFTFVPGKAMLGIVNTTAPLPVREIYGEAEISYYAGANRAAVVMCRATIEEALNQRQIAGRDLFTQIETAKTNGALTDVEYSMAHSARLVGKNAVHFNDPLGSAQVPLILSATIQIVNHLYP